MLQIEEAQNVINERISELQYPSFPGRLYEPIRYVLGLGGKRIRPVFALLACNLFSDDVEIAVESAVGLEIFHNFTLLHDDIMDRADLRRGHPTVHKKWCDNVALLSGDAMQIDAYRHIVANVPQADLKKVLDIFSQTAIEVCEGQQYDMDFESRNDVSLDEYLEMIRLKTAVLIACSLKIGAIVGGAQPKEADLLYQFGINFGMAFQLQDDLLDVYGDTGKFGKNIGGDILCNKKTYLLITALQVADESSNAELKKWLSVTEYEPQEKIKAITNVYNRLNISGVCQQSIEEYSQKAFHALQNLDIQEKRKTMLLKYADRLMQRES
jgi:geranylgeranyl diphosphate synthase, type II